MTVDNASMRAVLVCVACGCTVPPPFYGLEAPSTLPAGHVSLTAAGGGGCDSGGCVLAGGAGRFRLGIGNDQEVGVDGEVLPGWGSTYGFKVAYKLAPRDWLAFTVGLGATSERVPGRYAALGADLGVLFLLGHVRDDTPIFGAVRLNSAMPTWTSDVYRNGGVIEMATIPIGISHPLAPRLAALAEVGIMAGLETSRTIGPRSLTDDGIKTGSSSGLYGAVAIAWTP